ncbi:DNA-binding protein [Halorarius halobius]|uniref:DNA-binding protein n=1 Tax=Halorarius halobius TaxID=2962671 RepID=UPI0020CF111F|nr:DNA-binding protein [Halorarius halobius]
MSSYNTIAEKDSDASTDEQPVDETPELRATVQLETQAKVDTNHPDVDTASMTLEAEERFRAREAEKARTRRRFDRRESSDREARTRLAATQGSRERRRTFQRRAASVDPWAAPDRGDPHRELEQEQVAAVNQQASRIAQEVRDASSRAAVSRRLAERVADGSSILSASVAVMDAERTRPGSVVPIGMLEEVSRQEVSVAGTIEELWPSSHPKIAQVGLIADESGQTKFTSWHRSHCRPVAEGERVRIRAAALNWYQGRPSIALTGDTRVLPVDD